MAKKFVLSILSYFALGTNAAVAPFIIPCKTTDSACLVSSSQAALSHFVPGLPQFGVPSSDPLVLDNVGSNEGDLSLQFRNMRVTGLQNCVFLDVAMTEDKTKLTFTVECPINATGQYTVGGKLLFVAIDGDGDFEIKTDKIKLSVKAILKQKGGSDGKLHYDIESYDYSYELKEQFYFRLDNLFNGDVAKAKPILDILNHSWKEVINTFGKPIIEEIVVKVEGHLNNFLHAVPSEELLLN